MQKVRRILRMAALTKRITDAPHVLHSLTELGKTFEVAKSTLSEDVGAVREALEHYGIGRLDTVTGAAGGVRYVPWRRPEAAQAELEELQRRLEDPSRIIPGGFVYMADLLYDAALVEKLGELLMMRFADQKPDCILTLETKGIPLAMMVAKAFHIPLAVARQDNRVTEGSSISISYVTGAARRIRTMTLTKRAMAPGARVLIIDDFMKEGGTAKGMQELVREMGGTVVGVGVLVATRHPAVKQVENYEALLHLLAVDEMAQVITFERPNWVEP